jgi:hypothetical protein
MPQFWRAVSRVQDMWPDMGRQKTSNSRFIDN